MFWPTSSFYVKKSFYFWEGSTMKDMGSSRTELIILLVFFALPLAGAETIIVDSGESIQQAIDRAQPGDTVEVHGGSFRESINLNKSIVLVGLGRPLLDSGASANGIVIGADGAEVSGFDIRTSRRAGIQVVSDNNVLKNNSISGCVDGIRLEDAHGNTIALNEVNNNSNGIVLSGSSKNIIEYNEIKDNDVGEVKDCGIFLIRSQNNTIRSNNLSSNGDCCIYLRLSRDNHILMNNVSHSSWYGLSLEEDSNNNLVAYNYASDNKHGGIHLDSSQENTIRNNTALDNAQGIILSYDSNDNQLTGNNASNNQKGIHLTHHSSNNIVAENIAADNQYGIYLTFSSGWNVIIRNRLIDNLYNAYDMGLSNRWDDGTIGNYYSDLGNLVYIPGGAGIDHHPKGPEEG
jgi:nitrous oxidase accessory protein